MISKLSEIIAAAEKGVKEAPLGELQEAYGLIRDLRVPLANVNLHVTRWVLNVGGELDGWGGE